MKDWSLVNSNLTVFLFSRCQFLIAECVENVRRRKSSYAKKVGVIGVIFAVFFSVSRMEIFVYNPNWTLATRIQGHEGRPLHWRIFNQCRKFLLRNWSFTKLHNTWIGDWPQKKLVSCKARKIKLFASKFQYFVLCCFFGFEWLGRSFGKLYPNTDQLEKNRLWWGHHEDS